MKFYIAMSALLLIHLVAAIVISQRNSKVPRWMGLVHFLAGVLGSLAVMEPLLEANGVIRADMAYGIIAVSAFVIVSAAVCIGTAKAALGGNALDPTFFLGASGALAAFIMALSVIDYSLFYLDPSKTGVANAHLLGATDVECEGMVIVKIEEHDTIYRCPLGIIWGLYSSYPFAPAYREGRSAQLKDKIAAMLANAEHVGGDHEKTRD